MYLQYLVLAACSFSTVLADTVTKRSTYYVSTNLPSGWSYQGCYSDSVSNRVLSGPSEPNPNIVTQEVCIEYCSQGGYSFAGVEFGNECYCGHRLASSSTKQANTDCYMPCSGNSSESCGGPNRLNLFSTSINPTTNPGPGGWISLGCYSDNTNSRTLKNAESIPRGVTVATCTTKCQQLGYQYAGVEYADECYCDDELQNNASPISSGCDMTCAGNSSEYCGGANSLNLYQSSSTSGAAQLPSGWSSLGCWTDNVSSRTLSNQFSNMYKNMTVESCLSTCQSNGFSLAGLEYSQECYCDNQINNQGQCALEGCNMHCAGNPAEICGGSNRLNMYERASGVVASCSTPQSSTSLKTASTSSTGTTSSLAPSFTPTLTSTPPTSTSYTTPSPSNSPTSPTFTTITTNTSPTSTTSHTSTISLPPCQGGAPCRQNGIYIDSCCPNADYVLRCDGETLADPGNCHDETGESLYATCIENFFGTIAEAYCTTYVW